MRIKNKKKFILRIIELLLIVLAIIITPKAIAYALMIRGYEAMGSEYLLAMLIALIIVFIEQILEEEV